MGIKLPVEVFSLRLLFEKFIANVKDIICVFLDLQKAYDLSDCYDDQHSVTPATNPVEEHSVPKCYCEF